MTTTARSLGDISVQLIMERFSGGGHLNIAGAQINDKTMLEVKEELLVILEEMFSEEA